MYQIEYTIIKSQKIDGHLDRFKCSTTSYLEASAPNTEIIKIIVKPIPVRSIR